MLNLVQGGDLDRVDVEPKDSTSYGFSQARFINHQLKRQLLSALLDIMKNYNHCSMANQLCV
jgi:hypothetical protein